MSEERRPAGDQKHRYGLIVPRELWEKIVERHWQERKSINQLILEILKKEIK